MILSQSQIFLSKRQGVFGENKHPILGARKFDHAPFGLKIICLWYAKQQGKYVGYTVSTQKTITRDMRKNRKNRRVLAYISGWGGRIELSTTT
jgi:hypothetical protein